MKKLLIPSQYETIVSINMKYRHPLLKYTILCIHFAGFSPLKRNLFSVLRATWSSVTYATLVVWFLMELFLNYQGFSSVTRSLGILPQFVLSSVKMTFLIVRRKNIKNMILKTHITLSAFYPSKIKTIGSTNMDRVYKIFKIYALSILCSNIQMNMQAFLTRTPFLLTYKEQEMSDSFWCLVFLVDLNFLVPAASLYVGYNWLFLFFCTHIVSEMKMLNEALEKMFYEVDSDDFKVLVDHHNHILSIVKDVNFNYSPILLMEYTLNFLSICFSLFYMTMDGFPPDSEHIIRYTLLAVNFIISMASYSYAGDVITKECEKVSTTFFYKIMKKPLNRKTRFTSFMMIGRGHKKTNISIGGFRDLNMETFYLAMRNCLSFLTFIQALRERGHGPNEKRSLTL